MKDLKLNDKISNPSGNDHIVLESTGFKSALDEDNRASVFIDIEEDQNSAGIWLKRKQVKQAIKWLKRRLAEAREDN